MTKPSAAALSPSCLSCLRISSQLPLRHVHSQPRMTCNSVDTWFHGPLIGSLHNLPIFSVPYLGFLTSDDLTRQTYFRLVLRWRLTQRTLLMICQTSASWLISGLHSIHSRLVPACHARPGLSMDKRETLTSASCELPQQLPCLSAPLTPTGQVNSYL
ncbi:hypothetical protein EDD17DRAFT_659434 [Pisolithus thermaeus]|nr:hypothetical protein EDD17DRAFT_659434 [Pisolithus thermaeus]